jgi:hypothetical protein
MLLWKMPLGILFFKWLDCNEFGGKILNNESIRQKNLPLCDCENLSLIIINGGAWYFSMSEIK